MGNYFKLYWSEILIRVVAPFSVSLVFLVASYYALQPTAVYRDHGLEKKAIVQKITPRERDTAELQYYYWDDNAVSHEFTALVQPKWRFTAENTKQVTITYLPEEPANHYMGGATDLENAAAAGEYLLMAAIVLIAIAIAFGIVVLLRVKHIADVVLKGSVVSTVVAMWIHNPLKKTEDDQLKYHFSGSNGRWYEGHSMSLPPYLLKKFPVGTKILICFDAANPNFHQVDLFGLRKHDMPAQ